jgi:hypothetical protein
MKGALRQNPHNMGIGLLHEPTGRIYVAPFDDVPGGHTHLAAEKGVQPSECKGFVVCHQPDGSLGPLNLSHLNGPQGQPGSLQMPQPTFDGIAQALKDAGL